MEISETNQQQVLVQPNNWHVSVGKVVTEVGKVAAATVGGIGAGVVCGYTTSLLTGLSIFGIKVSLVGGGMFPRGHSRVTNFVVNLLGIASLPLSLAGGVVVGTYQGVRAGVSVYNGLTDLENHYKRA